MLAALKDLFASKKFLAALTAVIVYVGGRFGFDVDPTILDRIFGALLVYIGAQGMADVGKSAALVARAQVVRAGGEVPSLVRTGSAGAPIVLSLFLIGVGAMQLNGCSSLRSRSAAGVQAVLDCEAPGIKASAAELAPLFEQALLAAIRGDGSVDTTALRNGASVIKTDLARCALAAAVAVISTPDPTTTSAPRNMLSARPPTPDPAVLREAFIAMRVELGWAPMLVSGGTL